MTLIQKDIFDIKSGILVYRADCKSDIEDEIAKRIRANYPEHEDDCLQADQTPGNIVVSEIVPDAFYIIGLFVPNTADTMSHQADYEALCSCLKKLALVADVHSDNLQIFIPYKMCYDQISDDWEVIESMMDDELPSAILIKRKGE